MENRNFDDVNLIRKAYNKEKWEKYAKCSFAFFPGCQLAGSEPEIVIKAYDSLRFQKPDTGLFLNCCGMSDLIVKDADMLAENFETIRKNWEDFGKPTMILACPGCCKMFKTHLPEIPTVSIYEMLQELEISGGCNSEDYIIVDAESAEGFPKLKAAVRELAEEMGVKLHEPDETADTDDATTDDNAAGVINDKTPRLVYSMKQRNMLKKQGKEAAHILELIYGMGASNVHLEHEHDHEDGCGGHGEPGDAPNTPSDATCGCDTPSPDADIECDGNCAGCASLCSSAFPTVPAPLPTDDEMWQNRIELKKTMLEFFWNEF